MGNNVYVIPSMPAPLRGGDWEITEVKVGDRYHLSDELKKRRISAVELAQVMRELSLLRAAGCPADTSKGTPNIEHLGKYRCYSGQVFPYCVLKCKPGPWRLYFYVLDRDRRLAEILFAVCKKTDPRDASDIKRCKTILKKVESGATESAVLDIPPHTAR